MVRKKELKQRAIYVYPPAEMAERWRARLIKFDEPDLRARLIS